MRPTALESKRRLLELREIPAPASLRAGPMGFRSDYLRCYTLGECTVIVTREFDHLHLSISHRRRYPTWDEIAEARYRILPKDQTFALVLPPLEEYVNMNPNCFQLSWIPSLEERITPP